MVGQHGSGIIWWSYPESDIFCENTKAQNEVYLQTKILRVYTITDW